MVYRLPIVAYEAGAVAETLRGSGILLRDKRPEWVAELVERVLGEPALREAVLRGQDRALEELCRTDFRRLLLDRLAPVLGPA